MKEIVESYFQRRSLVNHQLMSYNDTILGGESRISRMEKIVRNIVTNHFADNFMKFFLFVQKCLGV